MWIRSTASRGFGARRSVLASMLCAFVVLSGPSCSCPPRDDAAPSPPASVPLDPEALRAEVEAAERALTGTPEPGEREAALRALDSACTQAPAIGCGALAEALRLGGEDRPRALEVARRGCDARGGRACLVAGRMLRHGQGVPRDDARAFAAFARGCELAEPSACLAAGVLVRDGDGVAADPARALELFVRACDGEIWPACAAAVPLVGSTGATGAADLQRVRLGLERGCDAGDADSCAALGAQALARDADDGLARSAFGRACNAGDLRACVESAALLTAGRGGAPDPALARQLLDAACRGGEALGCSRLADAYASGDGVAPDPARAAAYRAAACALLPPDQRSACEATRSE